MSTGSTGAEAVEPLGQENLPQAWNFAGKMNMVGARYDMCKKYKTGKPYPSEEHTSEPSPKALSGRDLHLRYDIVVDTLHAIECANV